MDQVLQKPATRTDEETLDVIRGLLVGKLVKRAYLFGSRARGDASPESDWDILIEVERGFSLFDQARMQILIEDATGQKIDLVTEGGVRPGIQFYIDQDKILLYES